MVVVEEYYKGPRVEQGLTSGGRLHVRRKIDNAIYRIMKSIRRGVKRLRELAYN